MPSENTRLFALDRPIGAEIFSAAEIDHLKEVRGTDAIRVVASSIGDEYTRYLRNINAWVTERHTVDYPVSYRLTLQNKHSMAMPKEIYDGLRAFADNEVCMHETIMRIQINAEPAIFVHSVNSANHIATYAMVQFKSAEEVKDYVWPFLTIPAHDATDVESITRYRSGGGNLPKKDSPLAVKE